MVNETSIVTMEHEQEFVCGLSNGAIFNDLKEPKTMISRSHQYSTLNISVTAQDSDTFTMEDE